MDSDASSEGAASGGVNGGSAAGRKHAAFPEDLAYHCVHTCLLGGANSEVSKRETGGRRERGTGMYVATEETYGGCRERW